MHGEGKGLKELNALGPGEVCKKRCLSGLASDSLGPRAHRGAGDVCLPNAQSGAEWRGCPAGGEDRT